MGRIKIFVRGQELRMISKPLITSGNKDVDYVDFIFDETWDFKDAKFYASFYMPNSPKPIDVELENGSCALPRDVTAKAGVFLFNVRCEIGSDKMKTSNIEKYIVSCGELGSDGTGGNENTGNSGGSSGNVDLSDYAKKDEIPTKTSQLENDSGFITAEDLPENVKGINNMYTYSQDISLEGDQDSKVSVAVNYTDGTTDYFDFNVTNGKDGADGKDYVLTEEDKNEIANNVVDMFGTSLLSIIGTGVVE